MSHTNWEMQHKLAQRIFDAKIALAGDNLTAWSKCVHGEATAEQVAALMAILSRLYSDAPPRTYEQRVHDMARAIVGAHTQEQLGARAGSAVAEDAALYVDAVDARLATLARVA